jgi:hypothetical protein
MSSESQGNVLSSIALVCSVRGRLLFLGLALAMSLISSWGIGAQPAAASALTCRTTANHQVCILSIRRSAKYHWQYRATVTLDGTPQPEATYNCRHQRRTDTNGKTERFEAGGAGEVICALVN